MDSARRRQTKENDGKGFDYDMCVCGHVRYWHYGKCLMVTLDYEDHISKEYGFCGCAEFRKLKKETSQGKKKKSRKIPAGKIA